MKSILIVTSLLAICVHAQAQTPTEQPTEAPPGWWNIPKTPARIKLGGYVKFDLIHDFDPIASPDYFDVSKIPTDGSKGESTHLHAKETRLYIDVRSPSKVGELRAYIEGDFYGSGGAFRLRHAFVEINDKWLAGQWWSNFMDENIIPATLDFEKPAAYVFARHAMLRYKQALSHDAYFAVAVEEPNTVAEAPTEPGQFENPLPDLTARYRIIKGWGHVQVSAFGALVRYRLHAGGTDDVALFAANLSGQLNVLKKDKLIYQLVYGPGAARYRGGLSAVLDGDGELVPLTDMGLTAGYQHYWNDRFSSLFVYNHGAIDNEAGQPSNAIAMTNYLAANLLWHFTENAFAGVEYLHGKREDASEANGTANRLQFSVKYSFN